MSNSFVFQIHSLFRDEGNDVLSSPIHAVFVVHEVERLTGILINRLAKVTFDDPHIHQRPGSNGPTGYQTYLLGTQYNNELWLGLFIDMDVVVVPVAVAFASNRSVAIRPGYQAHGFLRHLTLTEITAVFNHAFDHPDTIAIQPKR